MRFASTRSLLSVPLSAIALAASTAFAAPVVGPADQTFYNVPATLPAANGELISYRTTTVNLGADAPAVKAWNVIYRSTDSVGAANAVSGTVLVPTKAWTGGGARPIISYAVGTHGLAQRCAPSVQLRAGTDYENANIAAALNAGYAVVVSDYAGYLNGQTPTYLAGGSQGRAVLDIVRAAAQIPSVGLSTSAKVGIWGFSQGGQTAGWAGELLPSYGSGLNVVGVVAGGIPADFIGTAPALDGNVGASFLLSATIGLSTQYPNDIPFNLVASDVGKAAAEQGKQQCVFESLFTFIGRSLSEFTVGNVDLNFLVNGFPTVGAALNAQNLGTKPVPVPVYQFHGLADEFIPLGQAYTLKQAWCAKGTKVQFDLFPSEHIVTQFQGTTKSLSWLADRFAGKAATDTCASTKPLPATTNASSGANLIVKLDKWALTGTLKPPGLSTITLPAGATFTGTSNISSKQLSGGSLAIPDFDAKANIFGFLPSTTQVSVTGAGPVTGTNELTTAGVLKITASAPTNIKVGTTTLLGIPLKFNCQTSQPARFPLNFSGPVSALGSGKLAFSGTVAVPSLSNCGFLGGLLNSLLSGNNAYSFTVAPPAPTAY